MTLRLVGAGVGRTGTHSLKVALETLLGAPCYHMLEVFNHPEHVETWHAAFTDDATDLTPVFEGYAATVDWPSTACWERLADANPDAVVLLSTRADAATWWKSASATIFEGFRQPRPDGPGAGLDPWSAMVATMIKTKFCDDFLNPDAAMAAYDAHNAHVRATTDPGRLVEWQPGDGWEPLCRALNVAVPDEPFPNTNTTAEFRARMGWA